MTFTHDLVDQDAALIPLRDLPRVLGQRVSLLVDMLKEIAGYRVVRALVRCAVRDKAVLEACVKKGVIVLPDCYAQLVGEAYQKAGAEVRYIREEEATERIAWEANREKADIVTRRKEFFKYIGGKGY
jgi:hypothetical protein